MRYIYITMAVCILCLACGCSRRSARAAAKAAETKSEETVTVKEESPKKELVGAFTDFRPLTHEDQVLFGNTQLENKSIKGYKVLSVSTQVVAGINYRFLCEDEEGNVHVVIIYKPLPMQGDPRITSIDGKKVR